MDKLEKLVEELEGLMCEQAIVNKLQEIGAVLLTQYEIRIDDDIIIEPLRVEAYYFNKGFEDKYIHYRTVKGKPVYGRPEQRNHFGGLYPHLGWSGVDLVLSRSDKYALSFLIKNSRIIVAESTHECEKQISLAKYLEKQCSCSENWLNGNWIQTKSDKNTSPVFNTVRKGLTEKDPGDFPCEEQKRFRNLRLAMVIEIELKGHTYDFEKGFGKEEMVIRYLKDHKEIDRESFCKKYLGYIPSNMQ